MEYNYIIIGADFVVQNKTGGTFLCFATSNHRQRHVDDRTHYTQ